MINSANLFHFVIADPEAVFYLDSGLQINLDQKIYFDLCENCNEVFFLQDQAEGYTIKEKNNIHPIVIQKKGFKSAEQRCGKEIFERLKNNSSGKPNVVIADCGTFLNIYEKSSIKDQFYKLSQITSANRGIIVLKLPQRIDSVLTKLVEEDNVFTENEIFSPMFYSLRKNAAAFDLVEALKRDDQFSFFGEITKDTCKALLLQIQLNREEDFLSDEELKNNATLLYRLHTNSKLRRDAKMMTSLPCYHGEKDIYDWLLKKENFNKLRTKAKSIQINLENNQSFSDYLNAHGYTENDFRYVHRSEEWIANICSVCYPPEWLQTDKKEIEEGNEKTKQLHDMVYNPRSKLPYSFMKNWIVELYTQYKRANDERNSFVIKDIFEVICFVAKNLYISSSQNVAYAKKKTMLNAWLHASLALAEKKNKYFVTKDDYDKNPRENTAYFLKLAEQELVICETAYDNARPLARSIMAGSASDYDLEQLTVEINKITEKHLTDSYKKSVDVEKRPVLLDIQDKSEQINPVPKEIIPVQTQEVRISEEDRSRLLNRRKNEL